MSTKTIVVVNQKGGVGKTTTASTLAHGLALKGHQTLLIDTDPQGQAASCLGLEPKDGLFDFLCNNLPLRDVVVAARENLWVLPSFAKTERILKVWTALSGAEPPADMLAQKIATLKRASGRSGGLDYIIFDTGPTLGGLQDQCIRAADGVLIPTTPDYLSAEGVSRVWGTLQIHQARGWRGAIIGVLPTMFLGSEKSAAKEYAAIMEELQSTYQDFMLDVVHYTVRFKEAAAQGKTIFEGDPRDPALKRASEEYGVLVQRVEAVL